MGKLGNILNMLVLLKSRKKMKIADIARKLEVDERQVRRYRRELDQARINIKCLPGKYGGYVYDGKDYLLDLDLKEYEYSVLKMVSEQLKSDNFICYKDFNIILDKIKIAKKSSDDFINNDIKYFVKNIDSSCDYKREKKIWTDISAAIISKNKIKIKYGSLKFEEKERVVNPYSIFQYRGTLYFIGYCNLRQDIREFKVSRIVDYSILEEKFEKDDEFILEDYMKGCFGIFRDKELEVKLKIEYPMSQIVKEKVWVRNQQIKDLEDKSIIFKAKMRGVTEIKSWILSMGKTVQVIEPESLKREIKHEIENMTEIYKNI